VTQFYILQMLKEAGYLSPILVIFEDAVVVLVDIIGDHQLNDSLNINQFSSKWLLAILFTKQVRYVISF